MKVKNNFLLLLLSVFFLCLLFSGCSENDTGAGTVLRIANWEEYMDEGGWDEAEKIDLEDGTTIIGKENLIDEFEAWYKKTYGKKVSVEYSTFGTNEDMYNQMTLGDTFDVVCPSEYMMMKMMTEGELEPYSDEFWNEENPLNYYSRGVSPYIRKVFNNLKIKGQSLNRYAAGYMWGVMGIVYNPAVVSEHDVKHWSMLLDKKYNRRITMKDSIRDSYIVALGILNEKKLMTPAFRKNRKYAGLLTKTMNDTSVQTVNKVEKILDAMRNNAYSLETDSGKADMVTGKVVANMQWSGDGVYTMDQAEEDGMELSYAVPEECSNLWFDGWCMMKKGISGDADKKQAAEAFVNFVSRPDNAIRNMYYIGYTSVIAGGDNDQMLQYADWCYGTEEDEENTAEYSLSYFFTDSKEEKKRKKYVLEVPAAKVRRQIYAQYPTEDVIGRSAVMRNFNEEENRRISRMWINIRCFDGF